MNKLFKSITSNKGFIRYFKNTSWMMTEQMLRMLAGLFVGLWVARYLGPDQFGVFSYVLAFTAIFAGLAKLGLDAIVVREIINNPNKTDTYLGTAFWLKVIGSILAIAVIAIAIGFTKNELKTNLYIFIVSAGMFFQSFEIIEFYFQSKVLAKYVSICKLTQLGLSSLLKIVFVVTKAKLIWFVMVVLFDSITLAITLYIVFSRHKNSSFLRMFDICIAKELLKDSWPLMFSAVVTMVYMRIDQIMIQQMLGAYEVGIYSAAVRISEIWYFIPTLITASLFPAILNAKNSNNNLYIRRLWHLYCFLFWSALFIAATMTVLSDWIVLFLYGKAFIDSSKVLLIHAWSGLFVGLLVSSGKWLTAENFTKHIFMRNLLGAIANVVLNLLLIPIIGIRGAAFATLLSFFVSSIAYDFFVTPLHGNLKLKLSAILGIRPNIIS